MKAVSNASPLIFLAKIGKLELLRNYEIAIPQQIYLEIKKGENSGREDSHKIQSYIDKGIIRAIQAPINKEIEKHNLGEGEKAAISLAIDKKTELVLLDEKKARRVAKFYNLHPRGTVGILVEALNKSKINNNEFKGLIQNLIQEGFRISEELLMELLKETE